MTISEAGPVGKATGRESVGVTRFSRARTAVLAAPSRRAPQVPVGCGGLLSGRRPALRTTAGSGVRDRPEICSVAAGLSAKTGRGRAGYGRRLGAAQVTAARCFSIAPTVSLIA